MSHGIQTDDVKCELHQFERNRYFYGKLMTVRDFEAEQSYSRGHRHLHNQSLHGWGVVCGLTISAQAGAGNERKVIVSPGVALDCCGRPIVLERNQEVALDVFQQTIGPVGAQGATVYLCIKYDACTREPVPALANVSTCEEICDYNRIREGAAFDLLSTLPVPQESTLCETWTNTRVVQADIRDGDALIAEFDRVTPVWVRPGDVFEVRRRVTPLVDGQTIQLRDVLPAGFTLQDGLLDIAVPNTVAGQVVHNPYLVRVGDEVTAGSYDIGGQVLQSPIVNLPASHIEVTDTRNLEQQVQEAFFREAFEDCPRCAEDPNSHCIVLARITLQQQDTSFRVGPIENVTFDAEQSIYRRLVYSTPLLAELLACLKHDPRLSDARAPLLHASTHEAGGGDEINVTDLSGELADAQKVIVQDNGVERARATTINFLGGIDAVSGGTSQANISANVGNGLQIVGDQIRPQYGNQPNTVCEGNNPRLSDARQPLPHAPTHQNGGADEINVTDLSGELADAQKVIVQTQGNPIGMQTQLNFVGNGVSANDDAANNRINITIPGGGTAVDFPTGRVIFESMALNERRTSPGIQHGFSVDDVAILMALEEREELIMGDIEDRFAGTFDMFAQITPGRFSITIRDGLTRVNGNTRTRVIRWWAIPGTRQFPDVTVPRG